MPEDNVIRKLVRPHGDVDPHPEPEHLLLTHDSDISSPEKCEHSTIIQYENSFEIRPYCKVRTFIETKVAAINCGDLTHY